jgi:hypothetical protein
VGRKTPGAAFAIERAMSLDPRLCVTMPELADDDVDRGSAQRGLTPFSEATMRKTLTIGAAMLVLAGCNAQGRECSGVGREGRARPSASARLEIAERTSHVTGTAFFSQKDGEDPAGARGFWASPPGEHAFHIHEKGDCSARTRPPRAGHWNPTTENHASGGRTRSTAATSRT